MTRFESGQRQRCLVFELSNALLPLKESFILKTPQGYQEKRFIGSVIFRLWHTVP